MKVGDTARRAREVSRHDMVAEDLPGPGSVFLHVDWSFKAPVRPGDEIIAEAEVLEMRADKPIFRLRTTVQNQHGVTVLDGTAVVYREPLVAAERAGADPPD